MSAEQIARCLEEQRRCRDYLAEHGYDRGALQGLEDWVMEEALLSIEQDGDLVTPGCKL